MDEHYRIGRLELLPARRELRVDGRSLPVGGRAFDLLVALARQAGRVVSKEALYEAVWPGLAVQPSNLQVHVWTLRKLLGGAAIATVPRRGYQLVAEVRRLTGAPDPAPAADAALDPLLGTLRQHRLATLEGADAPTRRAVAQRAAQLWRARRPVWSLDAPDARPDGAAVRTVLRELSRGGGLVVLHDAQAAPRLGALVRRLLAAHADARLLLTAPQALRLPDEAAWTCPADGSLRGPGTSR